jgi:hypothetical protein
MIVIKQKDSYKLRVLTKLEFSRQIFEKIKYQISSKSVQGQPSCSMRLDGRPGGGERRTDMTKLVVAFCNSANESKNVLIPYVHRRITNANKTCVVRGQSVSKAKKKVNKYEYIRY